MVTVHKSSGVHRLAAWLRHVGRYRFIHVAVEVHPWLVIVEGLNIDRRVSGIKDQAGAMPLFQVRHNMQRYIEVFLLWHSKVG
jgi:hypothetical protein